jgi:hypothetical protein
VVLQRLHCLLRARARARVRVEYNVDAEEPPTTATSPTWSLNGVALHLLLEATVY